MENLKKFNTQEEYQAWKDGDNYVYPNVCKVGDEVIYDNYPDPFWIEALEDVTVDFKYYNGGSNTSVGSYSFDKKTWTKMPYGGVVVRTGQKLYIINGGLAFNKLVISGKFNVGGSILSLDYSLDYLQYTTHKNHDFNLFSNAKQVVSAKNLVLAIPKSSYSGLFSGCTLLKDSPKLIGKIKTFDVSLEDAYQGCISLTKAPTIPRLSSGTYTSYGLKRMFKGCSNLSYIKALFTQSFDSSYNSTENWVEGVSPTGTFIANAKRTDFTRGVSAIPEGWDLYLYDEDNDRYVVRFKVNNIPYEMYTDEPRDVTWSEFVESKQNTNGFKMWMNASNGDKNPTVRVSNLDYVLNNGDRIYGYDKIILNTSYTIGQPTETAEE